MEGLAESTCAALDREGGLARALPGFRPRAAQQALAAAIAGTLTDRGELLAEAGTGTGKTYAYLVPLLLHGARAVVSTGTRALQDQLFHRDLPRVRQALGVGLRAVMLKGRSNYLCLYRLEKARDTAGAGERRARLDALADFARASRDGDLSAADGLPEDSPLWPQVTSTIDNCLGGECPFWGECFVVKARQAAQAADLVVVNHHLLLADLALKEEGFGEILPGADAFVLDEAHQLPDLAAQFFGARLGARQLSELGRDLLRECAGVDGALASLQPACEGLDQACREARLALARYSPRAAGQRVVGQAPAMQALEGIRTALAELATALSPLEAAAAGLAAGGERTRVFQERLQAWIAAADGGGDVEPGVDTQPDEAGSGGAGNWAGEVCWLEAGERGFVLHRTPLDVSGPLKRYRERSAAAWVFTSATLAVGGGFDHVARRLGLEAPRTLLAPSPFDWAHQALCYLPPDLPDPASPGHVAAMLEAITPVLEASGGRAFVLFTSHRALQAAAAMLEAGPWPLFVQGRAPRQALLDGFRASGNGVLLGAASFWEGVDVAGDALSVVVIDRLPFASPDDPVLEARLNAIRDAGGNPFRDEQLPAAVIALKQGVGRLIRTLEDRGVLVLCDPRLVSRPYGRLFLGSLPPMPRTREVADVQAFFSPAAFQPAFARGDDDEDPGH